MMTDNVEELARQFVGATVAKLGTEEEDVFSVLKKVYDLKQTDAFEAEVRTSSQKSVFSILHSELSRSALTKAEELYAKGTDTFRADGSDYFLDGLLSVFDWSHPASTMTLASGLFFTAGLFLFFPVVAETLLFAGLAASVFKVVKNGLEVLIPVSPNERKKDLGELGQGIGLSLVAALPYSFKGVRALGLARFE